MTTSDSEDQDIQEAIEAASKTFDDLCQLRHEIGQEKYGKVTFLGNDVIRMMIEELADTANYARYQAVKLLLLQGAYEAEFGTGQSFKGTKEGWVRYDQTGFDSSDQ